MNNSGNIIDYMKIKDISKNIFSLVFNLVLIECTHLMEVYIMHSFVLQIRRPENEDYGERKSSKT